jgi:hypothetical protein
MSLSNESPPSKPATLILPENEKRPASIGWMAELGLKEGEWFHGSKPALRGGMRPNFALKTRVWCCGRLHSESFQGECAKTMFRGKTIPLSPFHIAKELHDEALLFYAQAGKKLTDEQKARLKVGRQNIRRALVELEEEGVAERRTEDGTPLRDLSPKQLKRLQTGKIRLYFFIRPRPAKNVPEVVKNDYLMFAFLPSSDSRLLGQLLKRLEVDLLPDLVDSDYLKETVKLALADYQRVESVARADYQKAEDVAAADLKNRLLVVAGRERIVSNSVSNIERKGGSSSSSAVSSSSGVVYPPRSKAEEEDLPASISASSGFEVEDLDYQTFKSLYPTKRFDEGKVKPAFEAKSKAERQRVTQHLRVYLGCERWVRAPKYIPLASNWLKTFDADPPPYIETKTDSESESVLEVAALSRALLRRGAS